MLLIGCVSGFPTGAVTGNELVKAGEITEYEKRSLLPFCNCSSPAFLINGVGLAMFSDIRFGICVFVSQLASTLFLTALTGIKRRRIIASNTTVYKEKSADGFSVILTQSVSGTVSALLKICAYVTLFSCLSDFIRAVLFSSGSDTLFFAAFCGILEITSGLSELSSHGMTLLTPFIAGAVTGFSSLSVLAQISFTTGVDMKKYLLGRLAASALTGALCTLVYGIHKPALLTEPFFYLFSENAPYVIRVLSFVCVSVFSVFCLCIACIAVVKALKLRG